MDIYPSSIGRPFHLFSTLECFISNILFGFHFNLMFLSIFFSQKNKNNTFPVYDVNYGYLYDIHV